MLILIPDLYFEYVLYAVSGVLLLVVITGVSILCMWLLREVVNVIYRKIEQLIGYPEMYRFAEAYRYYKNKNELDVQCPCCGRKGK
jgi:hypothetical protein